jgi:hypothetical protein
MNLDKIKTWNRALRRVPLLVMECCLVADEHIQKFYFLDRQSAHPFLGPTFFKRGARKRTTSYSIGAASTSRSYPTIFCFYAYLCAAYKSRANDAARAARRLSPQFNSSPLLTLHGHSPCSRRDLKHNFAEVHPARLLIRGPGQYPEGRVHGERP